MLVPVEVGHLRPKIIQLVRHHVLCDMGCGRCRRLSIYCRLVRFKRSTAESAIHLVHIRIRLLFISNFWISRAQHRPFAVFLSRFLPQRRRTGRPTTDLADTVAQLSVPFDQLFGGCLLFHLLGRHMFFAYRLHVLVGLFEFMVPQPR